MPDNPNGFAVIVVGSGVYGGTEVNTLVHLATAPPFTMDVAVFATR